MESKSTNFKSNIFSEDILPNGDHEMTVEFLQQITDRMIAYIRKSLDREQKILNFNHPHDLKSRVCLEIEKDSLPLSQIIDDCQTAFDHSVRIAHPRFFNQLSQGVDLVSLAGEMVTNAINSNMFTYEVSPFFNLVEEVVLEKMRKIIGWDVSDGIFSPGGSISNLYAVLVARHNFFPDTKSKGLKNLPNMIVYTSEHSHYSIHRAACIAGLGLENIRSVPVDERGKLRPDKLEEMIKESIRNNEVPLLVALTSGTTVLGAFDPIEECAELCKKYNIWLHVDAAWGGGCLLSSKYKHLMKGIEKADSITWNPHKLMGASLQCSAFLVKKEGLLLDCNEMNATYLFQQDKHYDLKYDTGDKTIQCGRHVDVFKLWLMWRAKGESGFEKQVNKLLDLASLFYEELKKRDHFEIVLENPEFTNVCFWYVPKSLESLDRTSDEFKNRLNRIAPLIKERMMQKGSLMVGYQPLDEKPNFFRTVFSNNATTKEDVLFMIDEIERLGHDL